MDEGTTAFAPNNWVSFTSCTIFYLGNLMLCRIDLYCLLFEWIDWSSLGLSSNFLIMLDLSSYCVFCAWLSSSEIKVSTLLSFPKKLFLKTIFEASLSIYERLDNPSLKFKVSNEFRSPLWGTGFSMEVTIEELLAILLLIWGRDPLSSAFKFCLTNLASNVFEKLSPDSLNSLPNRLSWSFSRFYRDAKVSAG